MLFQRRGGRDPEGQAAWNRDLLYVESTYSYNHYVISLIHSSHSSHLSRDRRRLVLMQWRLTEAMMREPPLGFERGHAAGTRGCDRLAIMIIHYIARSENAFDA